jgi:transposase
MPAVRMTMRKIKDVLRLKLDAKLSHEQIAASLQVSKGVVTKYVGLAAPAGLDWPVISTLDEGEIGRRLLAKPERPSAYVLPDYGRLHQELKRKGVTLLLLWEEYQADYAEHQTYRYTQFCEHYRKFAKQLKRSMRQIHRGGEKLFIDFAGPTIALTGGGRAHIFVAAMGASSYTFACATPRETMVDWIESTVRALAFYGGVPQLIVPDNPRALIKNADLNRRPFQKLPGSRASVFAALDAPALPALQALPAQRYEMTYFKTVKVHIDYHIEVETHHYSVPHALVGQVLEARITRHSIEILHRGQRVTSHARSSRRGGFTTISEHMPAAHRAHMEWTPQRLIHWGQSIGMSTGAAVTRLLEEHKHPEHGYRSCLGLLSLAKRYGKPRLEAACELALRLGFLQIPQRE